MRVLLRCDGGGSLGVGHVIRSLALAEAAVAAGHDVVVAGRFEGSFAASQLAAAPVEVVSLRPSLAGWQQLVDLLGRFRPEVLHVDSYEVSDRLAELVASVAVAVGVDLFGSAGGIGDAGRMVLSNMEDGTFGRRPADVVIDPTMGAELSPRPPDGSTWLLRGSRYTPVRQRVIEASRHERPVGQVARRVLVVMGGTDPMGLTPLAVELLARTGLALEVTAIAVGENAQRAQAAARGTAIALDVIAPVNDLAALMSASDLVVSAAGTSIWELCCIGVPTAVAWAVANQREGYERVVAAGAAVGLGGPGLGGAGQGQDATAVERLRATLTDPRRRGELVRAGRTVVDGLGAWRVVAMWEQAVRQLPRRDQPASLPATRTAALVARPATLGDARQLWQWRNDPATRAGSRSSAEVPWDEHLRWLTDSLARTDRMLLVVHDRFGELGPVGTARWDLRSEGEWEVSVTVAKQRRGQSLARPLLRAAEVALAEHTSRKGSENPSETARADGTALTAYLAVVHLDNRASRGLFETSGYVPDLPPDPQGFLQYRKNARVP